MKEVFKKFPSMKYILPIIIFSTIFYTIRIFEFHNTYYISWLNTLFSTLISVVLALIIAVYIFYCETEKKQKETKEKFNPLIEENLIDIWKDIANKDNLTKIKFKKEPDLKLLLCLFQDVALKQAIYSNVFNMEQTKLFLKMKAEINFHNGIIKQFINNSSNYFGNPDNFKYDIKFFHKNDEATLEKLKTMIETAIECFDFTELGKEISENKNESNL